ncbi:MAG: helix-turn-helix domain-containing protein [Streptosporangiaceae bacterium]|nr:helix-turn-helix domain-containing protein [Streptosporangiaceae bacterium]
MIKRYREEQRATQRELAAAAGMSVGALRDLEQGRTRSPRWGTVEELAAALSLDPAQRAELTRAWRSGDPARAPRRPHPGERPPGVRINVLGPVAAWRDGAQVVLGSVRQRAVLGLMALQAGAGVHRDSIIDLLWGERPPSSAVAEVQGYVSRLRRILGDGPARAGHAELVTTAGGCCYRLNAGPGHLDLAVFGQLIREAREVARFDTAHACERYERALGLWRGDVAVDIDLLRGHPAAVQVARQRAAAVLEYAEAAERSGAYASVLPHLWELCAGEPVNEQAHAWLMTALAASGQQSAALQVFTDLRRRLDTELGISPSPVLAQAHARVLRQQTGPPAPAVQRNSSHGR